MAVRYIKRLAPVQLPKFQLPDVDPDFSILDMPSGDWGEKNWAGVPIHDATRLPICWTPYQVRYLHGEARVGDPRFAYFPATGFGVKGSPLAVPKTVVVDNAGAQVLADAVGTKKLDDAGIGIISLNGPGSGDPSFRLTTPLRFGLPCHTIDTVIDTVSGFPATILSGHADIDQFTGGEVLFLTANAFFWYATDDGSGGAVLMSNLIAQNVAELNRCRDNFARVKRVLYFDPSEYPAASAVGFAAAISAAASPDVVGISGASSTFLDSQVAQVVDFFGL